MCRRRHPAHAPSHTYHSHTHTQQESSRDALDWLAQQGVELTSTVQLGGHSRARTHANTAGPNVGYAIMRALLDRLEKAPNVEVVSSAKVGGWVGGVGGWAVAVGVGGWVCGWV